MENNVGKDDHSMSLLYNTDFCDFGDFNLPHGSHGSSSRGSSEMDSDVEDTIYAHMYFEEQTPAVKFPGDEKSTARGEETGGTRHIPDAGANHLSVSLVVDTPPKSMVKKRKRRRHKRKQNTKRSEAPPSVQSAAAEEGEIPADDVIVGRGDITESSRVTETSEESRVFIDLTHSDSDRPTRPAKPHFNDIIVISSDSDRDTANKVMKAEEKSPCEPGDSVEGEGGSSESGESCEDSEEGVASSDMQLSDEQDDVLIFDDPWRISTKDKMGREAYERRYGNSKGYFKGKNGFKCANCKQRNHTHRTCPWPKRHQVCYLCGKSDHLISNCPNDLCTYCYQDKHRGRSCSAPWSSPKTQCQRCFMTGHHASICPDIWRQFHNTTYSEDHLVMISGSEQRREDGVFCSNCSQPGHYGFECTRTLPRGWPQPHLPLIAKYDLNVWPPSNLDQLRIEHGVSTREGQGMSQRDEERESEQRRKRKSSSGGGPSRKRARESWGERRDSSERGRGQSTQVKLAVGRHPSIKTRTPPTLAKIDRSMSVDAGLLRNNGSRSLLGTPPSQRTFDVPHSSSLLTTPPDHMPPPTRSFSSRSERRAEKHPHHYSLEGSHRRRDSEPAVSRTPRFSAERDFPREPLIATPSPYRSSGLNEQLHHHHGNRHNLAHTSGQYHDEQHLTSPAHNEYRSSHHGDARKMIEERSNRRMSFNNVYHETPPLAPPPYHRRLSDYSEFAGGGRTGPSGYHDNRHRRHATDNGRMVNSRGFRGQSQLTQSSYRH